MSDLRTAAQQALDSINELFAAEQSEGGERGGHIRTPATREHLVRVAQARRALHESCDTLRVALAQQAKPDHETRAGLAEQQVVQLAEERDHYRNLWQKAQQAEPLNLRDPAVQKRLASQWGYVPAAAQAEPVEPVGQLAELQAMLRAEVDRLIAAGIQPQRKPLPNHDQHCVDVPGYGLMAVRLVRAVERAHGIKE